MRAASGSMLPPVTGTPHSFQMTPHSTWRAVWVRMSRWRRSQSIVPSTSAPTAGTGALERVPHLGALLAHLDHPRLAAVPPQRAGVVRLAAARRVEHRAVEKPRAHRPLP